jgi:4-diphosphocytidyl-2-C-methyl-D-erythritol kinase
MISYPHAKINLGLRVVGKRPDGYHDIETVMVPIGWSDVLEAVTSALSVEHGERRDERAKGRGGEGARGFSYNRSGIAVPGDPADDLVVKAYRLFRAYAAAKGHPLPPMQAHLHKCIPPGSGLGGGSSDGASMLKLLAELFAKTLPLRKVQKEVSKMAGQLGSDSLFFMNNQPMQVMGRGDLIRPLAIPTLKGMHLMVVVPPIHIDTARAYRSIRPNRFSVPVIDIIHEAPVQWRGMLTNDFEAVIFQKHPTIREIKETLYDMGAMYASMSGTGSAVYGIFNGNPGRSVFEDHPGYKVWTGVL